MTEDERTRRILAQLEQHAAELFNDLAGGEVEFFSATTAGLAAELEDRQQEAGDEK